jgi:hypothetical protein
MRASSYLYCLSWVLSWQTIGKNRELFRSLCFCFTLAKSIVQSVHCTVNYRLTESNTRCFTLTWINDFFCLISAHSVVKCSPLETCKFNLDINRNIFAVAFNMLAWCLCQRQHHVTGIALPPKFTIVAIFPERTPSFILDRA